MTTPRQRLPWWAACALMALLMALISGPGQISEATGDSASTSATQRAFDRTLESSSPGGGGRNVGGHANALDARTPNPPDTAQLLRRAAQGYSDALGEYYGYYVSALRHRRALFDWQLRSAVIIFVVVILIVLSGVAFAAIQFFRGKDLGVSTIDASAGGLKVSSPVLGVILLALSLAFFYLYLVHIYPIREAITVGT